MLEPFRRAHADVDIVLREMNMADLYRMLDAGFVDFVFGVVDAHGGRWQQRRVDGGRKATYSSIRLCRQPTMFQSVTPAVPTTGHS